MALRPATTRNRRDQRRTGRETVAKVFGNAEPADMAAGEAAAGMDVTRPFSPGEPIGPYDGFRRQPRAHQFVTGFNIASRPRTHERVAFETLRGLVEAYDVAQMCIWHRIDSIRALDWSLVPARGFRGDADAAIDLGMAVLEKPDRETPFAGWLAKWLYDILAYDAGTLYRDRNRRGDVVGLSIVDGTSVAPLVDYWGRSPKPPTEAYVQYVNGLPWNWLTRDDLIYQPFRPVANSPYGRSPLETILLNANTDLRFQAYFLQRFTEGNIPEAFASAPETWSPGQIEQFQEYWDSFMLGDQAAKHQIRWMPGGSTIAWSNEKDFQDNFSLFLMRKTAAAFHVVPTDLGFTESVNRSSGETQGDVQHRVGELPLVAHVEGVLTHFLRYDLGLPLEFAFDTGQEKEDRLTLAQAWQIYIESGMASPDEGREQLLGLPGDPSRPTPRFFSTTRSGPIPLLAIEGVAGRVDPETFGPARDQKVVYQPFVSAPGVVAGTGTTDEKQSLAAEDAYQTQLRQQLQGQDGLGSVAKDGPTVGVTAQTGIVGYDLVGRDDDEDYEGEGTEQERRADLAKAERLAFRQFRKARRRSGVWRDFEFRHVDRVSGHRLNDAGRLAVRKATGQVAVAGLAVRAADTGRVLMLQRALDADDPAAGMWEFPGGHLEEGETPLRAAWREWSEETGRIPPPGWQSGTWIAGDGIYQGIVWTVESEACVPVDDRGTVSNPDDPDGDATEAIAWWDPAHLAGNPSVRAELLASLDDVLAAFGVEPLEKATDVDPKASPGQPSDDWPGWAWDQRVADYWAPQIADATVQALTSQQAQQVAAEYQANPPAETQQDHAVRDVVIAAVVAWLVAHGVALGARLVAALTGLRTDAYLIGAACAHSVLHGGRAEIGAWKPGDSATARDVVDALGVAEGLVDLLAQTQATAAEIGDSRLSDIARVLVDGTAAGHTPKRVADDMRQALSDPARVGAVAVTETTTASGSGAQQVYRRAGVTEHRWAVDPRSNICPVCVGNAAAGPVPVGAVFPSGDTNVPAHPRCSCAVLPTLGG